MSKLNNNFLLTINVLYSTFLILSNLAENKICEFYGFYFAGGLIFFPLTYIFSDVIAEVYGLEACKRAIWLAFCSNFIVIIGLYLVTFINPAKEWENQLTFEIIYRQSPRILFASFISFISGELINAVILVKLKIKTKGKYFWLRAIISSIVGVLVDNTLFCFIAFYNILPNSKIINIIFTGYIFKVVYEIIALPVTYKVVVFLRRRGY